MVRVSKHPDVRRDELLDVALRLCVDVGYEALNVEQVTREAGVAKGTFYYYFKTKTDMLIALVERWAGDLFDDLEARAPELTGTGVQRFRALLQLATSWKVARLDSAMASVPLLYKPENLELRHRLFSTWTARMRHLLLPIVAQGQADGSLDVPDPEATTDVVLALMVDGGARLTDRAFDAPSEAEYLRIFTTGMPALMRAVELVLGAASGTFVPTEDFTETYRAMRGPFLAALHGAESPNHP